MADITMCTNEDCKHNYMCYRFMAIANKDSQSYISHPGRDCVDNAYNMYEEIIIVK